MNETIQVGTTRPSRRRLRRAFATLAATGIAFFGVVPAAHAAQINFVDTALHHCVNDALHQSDGDPVTVTQAEPLLTFECDDSDVASFEGLQHFSLGIN